MSAFSGLALITTQEDYKDQIQRTLGTHLQEPVSGYDLLAREQQGAKTALYQQGSFQQTGIDTRAAVQAKNTQRCLTETYDKNTNLYIKDNAMVMTPQCENAINLFNTNAMQNHIIQMKETSDQLAQTQRVLKSRAGGGGRWIWIAAFFIVVLVIILVIVLTTQGQGDASGAFSERMTASAYNYELAMYALIAAFAGGFAVVMMKRGR